MPDQPVRPRRILVVDDDRGVCELLQLLLTNAGYAVTTVTTVAAAVTALTTTPADLVIGDVRLPDAPAFALVDRLAAAPATARLPLIICSGAVAELEAAGERLSRPCLAVVLKPFDIDDLLATVTRLLTS